MSSPTPFIVKYFSDHFQETEASAVATLPATALSQGARVTQDLGPRAFNRSMKNHGETLVCGCVTKRGGGLESGRPEAPPTPSANARLDRAKAEKSPCA